MTKLKTILLQFGVDCAIESKLFLAMIDASIVKREFLAFKLQATMHWQDKPYLGTCGQW